MKSAFPDTVRSLPAELRLKTGYRPVPYASMITLSAATVSVPV